MAGRTGTTIRRGRGFRRNSWLVKLDEPTVGFDNAWLAARVLYFPDDFDDT